MTIHLVTDTACDVPAKYIEQYGIHVLSAYVHFGTEESLKDEVDISREEFYRRLPISDPLPTTSAYSPGEAEVLLRQLLTNDDDQVLCIHLSGKLSSIIESTRVAAKTIGSDRITIIDSLSLSMGGGWQVIAAAEAIAAGKTLDEVIAVVKDMQSRFALYAAPSTMEYLRRSGRINALVAGLGELLDIKPMILVNTGEAENAGRIRTFKKVKQKFLQMVRENAPLERLAILHINNPEGAEELRQQLVDVSPEGNTEVVIASAAIGANFGPGGLGIVYVREES